MVLNEFNWEIKDVGIICDIQFSFFADQNQETQEDWLANSMVAVVVGNEDKNNQKAFVNSADFTFGWK